MTNKVTTHWKGNMQFESDNPNGKTVLMDTSPEHGGYNSGLSPKAMMLSLCRLFRIGCGFDFR